MTQKDKAKAYDEALERARRLNVDNMLSNEAIEEIFPEVAESNDERIRKGLQNFLWRIANGEMNDRGTMPSAKMCQEWIAYLEKQKESLPISETCKENANSFADGIIEVRSFQRGMEEGRRLERQKEQKPVECIEFDNEFEKQVSHLLASVLNGEWEYNEGFVKHAAQSLLGYAKNELKQELPLMGGDTDTYFDDLRMTTKPLTSREWFDEGIKYAQRLQKEQKPHTDEEKEYIRTIKSIISDFIRDKKPENLAYYQRIYDWLDGRHVPFSCGHEKGQPADPVFSKQEYESHPIISTDTTSAKPAELDGKTLLYTADKSYQIGFRDGVASVKPAEWSEDIIRKAVKEVGLTQHQINWFKTNVFPPKQEWNEDDEHRRDGIIQWLREYQAKFNPKYDSLSIESIESLIDWLKSLRPSWKPSEEQMAALEAATVRYQSTGLESLYEELKKL